MRAIALYALILFSGALSSPTFATSPPQTSARDWQKWHGGWVRLEADGNLSCLSTNGTNCYWHHQVTDPKTFSGQPLQPLVCGIAHAGKWGGRSGYNDADNLSGDRHWCRSAYATLFAKWEDYSTLGAKVWLSETPAGDAMCHSADGRTCTPVKEGDDAPPTGAAVHPLVCGAHLNRIAKKTGYDEPGHWCQLPRILYRAVDLPVSHVDWRDLKTPAWTSDDEPAVVIRTKVPEGRSLKLITSARLASKDWRDVAFSDGGQVGFEFGSRLRFHLDVNGDGIDPWPLWILPRTGGGITAGMKVTSRGNMCFFNAPDGAPRDGQFIALNALIGNTVPLRTPIGQPFQVLSSAPPWENVPTGALLTWRSDAPSGFKIDELLVLAARRVPVEGDLTGKKRKISYAEDCDRLPVPL
ncbi:MAG: hypothetical protein EOP37_11885 [Rubrivivax sp.]|nr:MAG: hypothetical protein EOP37_11885 [Rubrivivax sp.]